MIPPVAEKRPRKYEIHGREIVDNYYWLRNRDTDEVLKYLGEENTYADEMMAHTRQFQETLFQEIKGRINETDETVPIRYGNCFYYARNEAGKNYRIHCRKLGSLEAAEEVILDENVLAEGKKYLNIGSMKISDDQNLLAYTADFTGGETYELHILNLSSREVIDRLAGVAAQLEWDSTGSSLFYTELDDIHRVYAVSRHVVGTPQSKDIRMLEEKDKTYMLFLSKTKDHSHLLIYATHPTDETSEIRVLDLSKDDYIPTLFFPRAMKREPILEHHGRYFYILSNHEEQFRYRLYRTLVSKTGVPDWECISDQAFDARRPSLYAYHNNLVIYARKNGYASLSVYDIDSGRMSDIDMPESIYSISFSDTPMSEIFYSDNPDFKADEFRFYFSSPVTPKSDYEYNMQSGLLKLLKVDEIKNHNPSQYLTKRRYAKAKDGTKIPISLAYRRNLKLDGTSPLLLYGYGSYGIPSDPGFIHANLSLLERGMILAYAHVRGGGEYGKVWYHSGKLRNKMNTFTDFIACAKYLVRQKFTTPDKLCAWGRSAGGLLMGAIANLRPDLFKCILTEVPFVDVLNTMLDDTIPLTTFEYTEWGDPHIKEELEWMIQYSPYDNIEAKSYPEMLITAGYNDPRVSYWEPAKWTAKLRALKTDNNRLLLKTKMETGHASAAGRYDVMRNFAFKWAFILDSVGLLVKTAR